MFVALTYAHSVPPPSNRCAVPGTQVGFLLDKPEGQAKAKRNPWLKGEKTTCISSLMFLAGSCLEGPNSYFAIARGFSSSRSKKEKHQALLYVALTTTEEARKHEDSRTQTSFNIGVQAGDEP
jgi:hypothetical protein